MNPAEFSPMDPRLEQALHEIRNAAPDAAEVEAAAARVWARLHCPGTPALLRRFSGADSRIPRRPAE